MRENIELSPSEIKFLIRTHIRRDKMTKEQAAQLVRKDILACRKIKEVLN